MATFLKEPQSATGIVEEDVKLLVVNNHIFEAMVKANSGIAYRIIKKLAERIKNTNKQLEIMMFKDANRKIVYGIVNATDHVEVVDNGVRIKIGIKDLVLMTDVKVSKVKEILDLLISAKLILPHAEGFIVSQKKKLFKFLEFLALKEELGEFSSEALKAIIVDQRLNTD